MSGATPSSELIVIPESPGYVPKHSKWFIFPAEKPIRKFKGGKIHNIGIKVFALHVVIISLIPNTARSDTLREEKALNTKLEVASNFSSPQIKI